MPTAKIKYDIYSVNGEKIKQIDLNPAIFGVAVSPALVHQSVVAQLANARRVLAHTKDRSAVRGGGRKPWRQKGTGRARHGSTRSPIWIGGGVTFGPTKERNYNKKINKKMKRQALFMALSDRIQNKRLVIIDKFSFAKPKTKSVINLIQALQPVLQLLPMKKSVHKPVQAAKKMVNNTGDKAKEPKKFDIKNYKISILIVVASEVSLAVRIARNIPGVKIISANALNILDVLSHRNLLLTQPAVAVIEQIYLK